MMRLVLKMIMMSVIMVGLASYAGYLMTGQLPFSLDSLSGFSKPDLSKTIDSVTPDIVTPSKLQRAYKWQDADGVWHYTNTPPPEGIAAKEMKINPNTNVIAGTKIPPEVLEEPAEEQPKSKIIGKSKKDKEDEVKNPYSPEGIKDLMEQARGVQEMMNERAEAQEKAFEQLGR